MLSSRNRSIKDRHDVYMDIRGHDVERKVIEKIQRKTKDKKIMEKLTLPRMEEDIELHGDVV